MIHKMSSKGAYHRSLGKANQDVIWYDTTPLYEVIALADGVSQCSRAKCGAEIASRTIGELLVNNGEVFFQLDKKEITDIVMLQILYRLNQKANEDLENIREYSSTVSSVLIDKRNQQILVFSLGDGIVISTDKERCRILAMPYVSSDGCCATTTDGADQKAFVAVASSKDLQSVTICSDGAWKQMYNKNKMKPEVEKMLVNQQFDDLEVFLTLQNGYDDCSFVSALFQNGTRKERIA